MRITRNALIKEQYSRTQQNNKQMTWKSERSSRWRQLDRVRMLSHSSATHSLYNYLSQTRELLSPVKVTADDENEMQQAFKPTPVYTKYSFCAYSVFVPTLKCPIFLSSFSDEICLWQTTVKTFSDAHPYTPKFPV